MTPSRTTRTASLRARIFAAVVSIAGVFLLVDGVIAGQWIQVLCVVLMASSAWSWWNDTRRVPGPRRAKTPGRFNVPGQIVCCLGMGAAGVVVVMAQGSVLQRIGGCLLVLSAVSGAVAVFFQTRPATTTPVNPTPMTAVADRHDTNQPPP